jgi:hypothetical protein
MMMNGPVDAGFERQLTGGPKMESFAGSDWGAVWLAMIPLALTVAVLIAEGVGWVERSDGTSGCRCGSGL